MSDQYDYPFPNAKVAFWIMMFPVIILSVIACRRLVFIVGNVGQMKGELPSVIFMMLVGLVFFFLITLVFNAFPTIRVISSGLEIRFFLPFLTRWFFLPSENIDDLVSYQPHSNVFTKERNMLVISQHLPAYYLFPSLVFGRRIGRGFIIRHNIKRYRDLVRRIADIADREVKPPVFLDG